MNQRVLDLQMGINNIIINQKFDVTQGDKNTHFIKINFNEDIELIDWNLLVYFKTMYPSEIFVDTYGNLQQSMDILIPNKALQRNGKLRVEFALQKDNELITINKFVEINVLSTINGTFLNANLGENTQNNIAEQLQSIQGLINQTDEKIKEYNTNAQTQIENFNANAIEQGKEYVNAVKTEGDTWVLAVQNEGDIQYKRINDTGSENIQNLNTEYDKKIQNLDTTITNYIVANNDKFKGEPGKNGVDGQQGNPGLNGVNAIISNVTADVDDSVGTPSVQVQMGGTESNRTFNFSFSNLKGKQGVAGTTDYNQLNNKPDLNDFYAKNQLFSTTKSELAIQLKSNNNQAQYEEWTKNNVRKIIYGFESASSNDKFVFNGYANTFLEFNGFTSITMRSPYVDLGRELRMGVGQNFVNFSPDGNGTKSLKFFNESVGANAYFNLESLGTMSFDTNNTNNNRTYDISFKRNGNEKGQIGYSSGKLFLWNRTSQKTFEMLDNGDTKLPANNLRTRSKEVIGSINELLERIEALERK